MTNNTFLLLTAMIVAFSAAPLSAGEQTVEVGESKMVIALKTDDFELVVTDISDLGVGDAETIFTETGQTIDLLRTTDGVEIYVDGELLDTALDGEGLHEGHHIVHKQIDVECDSEKECEEIILLTEDEDFDLESMHHENHHEKIVIIRKEVESD